MPPKASSSHSSASAGSAAPAPAGGGTTTAAAQPPQAPEAESFVAQKLQWALAVPAERRQPSMQAFIDSCECTTEATRLLAAAPLVQLSGPAKLRALLLLLKAYWCFGGRAPHVPGVSLLYGAASAVGHGPEQAAKNLGPLLMEDPKGGRFELQPLYAVASYAAYLIDRAVAAIEVVSAASIANSSVAAVSGSIYAHRAATMQQAAAPGQLSDVAGALEAFLNRIKHDPFREVMQRQAMTMGCGYLSFRELERGLLMQLALVHTWAATPDGAYCGGRIDEQHTAAGRAAFNAALELSDSDACSSSLLVMLSNLLRRTGAVPEAETALRRALAAARAAGDAMQELNAAAALFSVMASKDGWQYAEGAALVGAMKRRLRECKPWLPNPHWSDLKEKMRDAEGMLSAARHDFPATFASQPLPRYVVGSTPNTFIHDKTIEKIGDCSGCGAPSLELKFCSRCRSAKYCSRACQVAHWKAGHKAECAQLAERSDDGSSRCSS